MRKKMKPTKSAATVTIVNAPGMTNKGRAEIAKWLRRHAGMLERDGALYTKGRFIGRYMYESKYK